MCMFCSVLCKGVLIDFFLFRQSFFIMYWWTWHYYMMVLFTGNPLEREACLPVLCFNFQLGSGPAFTKRLEWRLYWNSKFQYKILSSILLLRHYNFVCLWNMWCFTGMHNCIAVAMKLNKKSINEILSLSVILTRDALWKPDQIWVLTVCNFLILILAQKNPLISFLLYFLPLFDSFEN